MRIERLELTRFGHFTDHVLDFGSGDGDGGGNGSAEATTADLHVIYGANEAGKSTTLEALGDLLFGVPLRSPYDFLHEYKAMEIGARIRQNGKVLELRRFKNSLADARGTRLDGGSIDVHGLSRESFRARFSFDAATLESGSEAMLASQGDLGEALFSASTGLPDIHARIDAAMAESDRFYEPRKVKDKLLPALLAELKGIEERIGQVDTQAGEWRRLRERAEALQARWEESERALEAERRRQLACQRELAAFAAKASLTRDREALAALGELPDTPPDWLPRLRDLQPRHVRLEDGVRRARERCDALAARRDAITVETALIMDGESIDELIAERSAERQRDARIAALDESIAAGERQVESARHDLGTPADVARESLLPSGERLRRLDELAGEHTTLHGELASALEEHRKLVSRRTALREEDATTTLSDPAPLRSLVVHVRERSGTATLDVLERQTRESARELAAALDALAPWRGDADALSALSTPPRDALAAERAELEAALLESRRVGTERRAAAEALAALERERAALAVDARLDDAHADAVRGRRDAAWRAHTDTLDALGEPNARPAAAQRTARAFAEALAADDAIGAERLRASDRLARLRGLDAELAGSRTRLDALDRDAALSDGALDGARRALAARALALGLEATASPDDIERWLAARSDALERRARHLGHLAELEAARRRRDELSSRLHAALSALAHEGDESPAPLSDPRSNLPLPDASLDEALAFADERLRALDEAAEHRRARRGERERLESDLRLREEALAEREANIAAWEGRWRDVLDDHWLGALDAAAVIAMLPALRALEKRLDALATAAAERDRLLGEQVRYLDRLRALLGAEGTAGDDPESVMTRLAALGERLATARRVRDEHARLTAEHGEAERELERSERELAPLSAELDGMRAPFGATTLTELDAALEKTRERRRLVAAIDAAERGLGEALGVDSVEAALARLDALDRDALESDAERLERAVSHAQDEAGERRLEARRAQDALDAVSGDAEAARLVERRANLLLEIRERAEETLRMRLGREAVLEGVRRYRDVHRGSLLEGARDAFVTLTGGRYADLQTLPDVKGNEHLRIVDADGRSLETGQLSDGTRFQLYLALRIAAYHDYARHRTPLPFVADDVMESFDETRTGAALDLLQRMARRGQIIYLTHHRRVVEIAREITAGAVRVHELPERG